MTRATLLVSAFFSLLLVFSTSAAVPSVSAKSQEQATSNASAASGKTADPASPVIRVKEACLVDLDHGFDPDLKCLKEAGLSDTIQLKVENLDQLLKEANDKKIVLFVGPKELKGIQKPTINVAKGTLTFRLWNEESDEIFEDRQRRADWASVFGFRESLRFSSKYKVSVGIEGQAAQDTGATLTILRMHRGGWPFLFVLVGMVLIYWWAAVKGAFSDRGSLGGTPGAKPAVSLARVQMGWWFFLVVGAFFYIWITMGFLPDIPPSVLALIGIASGTALSAGIIDSNKRTRAGGKAVQETESLKKLTDDKEKLGREIQALDANDPARASKQQAIDGLDMQIVAQKKTIEGYSSQQNAVSSSGSRLCDMLSDANGVSFHRLQMAIWTVVLGIVFVDQVASNLTLPEFDESLLALMGISVGTYLGFKLPEQQPQQQAKVP